MNKPRKARKGGPLLWQLRLRCKRVDRRLDADLRAMQVKLARTTQSASAPMDTTRGLLIPAEIRRLISAEHLVELEAISADLVALQSQARREWVLMMLGRLGLALQLRFVGDDAGGGRLELGLHLHGLEAWRAELRALTNVATDSAGRP
ncbi:hypothetical protein [Comamonas testosteroni]|uniref:hypothetical protein n=1 Tax=Comamonas testosteroni TaxID=285 RepID=UPI0028ED89FD|nr:hypothetical protein [Comamonas testosteroni]